VRGGAKQTIKGRVPGTKQGQKPQKKFEGAQKEEWVGVGKKREKGGHQQKGLPAEIKKKESDTRAILGAKDLAGKKEESQRAPRER